jgi:predicted dehydrogenase
VALRIGLIGCGKWGRLILRDLLACGAEVRVIGLTTASLEAAVALGAHSTSCDLSGLEQMDGFVVATPTATHAEVIDRLAPMGRPIFVEKPMTADVLSARRLAAASEGQLFVMDKWRYHPGIDAMRAEIAAGRVGEVLAIRTTRWGWGNRHGDVSALWILAPHDLAIVLHLVGDIPPVSSAYPVSARQPDLGVTAHLRADRGPSVTLDIGIASPDHRRQCLVIGSRATLHLRDSYDNRVFVRDGPPGLIGRTREGH